MKNLKVGAKILSGFGIVIAFMLVIGIIVTITNISSMSNMKETSLFSDFQTKAFALRGSFSAARSDVTVFTATPSSTMPTSLQANVEQMKSDFVALEKLYDESPDLSSYSMNITSIASAISTAESNLASYQQLKSEMTSASGQLLEACQSMRAMMLSMQETATKRVGALTPGATETEIQLANLTVTGMQNFFSQYTLFELQINKILLSGDISGADDAVAILDGIKSSLETSLKNSSSVADANILANTDRILNALSEAKATFERYRTAHNSYDTQVTAINKSASDLWDAINRLAVVLDDDMSNALSTTVSASNVVLWVVIAIVAVAVALAVLLSMIIMRGITVPLGKMKVVLDDVGSTGNMDFPDSVKNELRALSSGRDEISQCIGSFAMLMDRFLSSSEQLVKIADGDLSMEIALASDRDTMGRALQKMLSNLNNMFSEINTSSEQVSTGSKQIADGAQSLAQGSTEQASAVEELSSSITEVAAKTRRSAEMATNAAQLSETIKNNAQTGSDQMSQMISAVQEINEASKSISKVIQVIDNIAFQTNILALNAAVEAARAGQHGRGFAVVAEEVRNLATKSAAAAKDTGEMIANSMEKAALGARIAQQTATSLSEIVRGINESYSMMRDIASSSEEQALAISQINSGIDQVAQVVQSNSSTAEESAAASEEMSGQSAMLLELISQFRLRDGASRPHLAAPRASKQAAMPPHQSSYDHSSGGYGKY